MGRFNGGMFYQWMKAHLGQGTLQDKHKLGIWKELGILEERGGAGKGTKEETVVHQRLTNSFIILLFTSPASGSPKILKWLVSSNLKVRVNLNQLSTIS